ncbi:MAG: SPOR domain-containing protein [Syntrophobacteraceae bacterium]
MGSTNKTGIQSERREPDKGPKRYHFEITFSRIAFYCFCLVATMSWMFVFGVLVGRGTPFVDVNSKSLQAQLLRFLGLGREMAQPVERAADTWDPNTVSKSLEYYENLTQKNTATQSKGVSASQVSQKTGAKEATTQKPKVLPLPPPQESDRPAQVATRDASPPDNKGGEHFTLLVVSLKDQENAQRMVEQLRTKGYAPRMETIDLNTAGRWNRVLVGSFKNREEALRFAAEFNRKEHMEGLVIRESQ